MKTTRIEEKHASFQDAFWRFSSPILAFASFCAAVALLLEKDWRALIQLLFMFMFLGMWSDAKKKVEIVHVNLLHAENSNVYRCFNDDIDVNVLASTEEEASLFIELLYGGEVEYEIELLHQGIITQFDLQAKTEKVDNTETEVNEEA
jgi:hypothetical protein